MSMTDSMNGDANKEQKPTNVDWNQVNKFDLMQQVTGHMFKPIFDVISSEQTLVEEYQKIKNKVSNLSRSKRDLVVLFVEQWIPLMDKMMAEEKNQKDDDTKQAEQATVER